MLELKDLAVPLKGSNEPVNGHVEADSSAFVLVSGLGLDDLIIRRSEVRVLPAPLV
jgi:hypothetical protein